MLIPANASEQQTPKQLKSDMKYDINGALLESAIDGLPEPIRGKVRDIYVFDDCLMLVASDRLSAFDVVMPNGIPDKGKVLTFLSKFWFEKFDWIANHLISMDIADYPEVTHPYAQDLEGRSMLVRKLEPLPVEAVARGYLIGSAGLGTEIDRSYIDGFVQSRKRRDVKPHLEKLFSDPSLITRQLVEDVLKFKRLDGVEDALATVADQLFAGGLQSAVLRDQLDALKLPAQLIWGEEDRIIPPVHAGGLSTDVATHTVAGAGHMVQMEAAAEVNRLIRQLAS